MAEWMPYFNLAVSTGALMVALLGLLLAITAPYVKPWERRYFTSMFMLLLAYIACDLTAQVSQTFLGADFAWLSRAGVFLELLFSVAIIPSFTAYLLHIVGEAQRTRWLLRSSVVVYAAYVAVLVVAQFSDAIYFFSVEDKCVLPGPLYPVLVVLPVLLMLLNLAAFVRWFALFTPHQRIAIATCTIVPLAATFLQAALFGVSVLVVGTTISALIMFNMVLADQARAHVRQLEKNAQRKAQVMALQMRPHFIYNVMSSIYYLCAQDPERAQRVTLDFTNYLRENFEAVAAEGEVPFTKELEHTRAYLAVERARLEGMLVVDIDCPHTGFRLPPLTLQPLVENAVKHGADPELPPLHVRVATRQEAGAFTVLVEDSGPGFDADPAVGHPASALANIRGRLASCGATLSFAPREGGGTVATICVPAEKRAGKPA